MKSQRNQHFENQVLSNMMAEIEEDRTNQFPGVTDLIFCLTKAYWKRTMSKQEETRQTKLYFTTGLALERALVDNWKGTRPLAGQHEDIFYHIDGYDEGSKCVVEMKSTRMGVMKGGKGNWRDIEVADYPSHWLKQMAAYCYITRSNCAKLVVLHLVKPELLSWDIEFSDLELTTNWMELQSRRTELMKAMDKQEAPTPFEYNMAWECGSCVFKPLCDVTAKS